MNNSSKVNPQIRQASDAPAAAGPLPARGDISSREDVVLLIDEFYDQVLVDDVLGYIFTDVAKLDVEAHLPIMYRFWESLLLGARTYSGNPMQTHIDLNRLTPLRPEHFHRWVALFTAVVNEHFQGKTASAAIGTAESIARSMQMRMAAESGAPRGS